MNDKEKLAKAIELLDEVDTLVQEAVKCNVTCYGIHNDVCNISDSLSMLIGE